MSENYIMLNGKRVDLTEEQLEKLGLKVEISKCFKLKFGATYFFINSIGDVSKDKEGNVSYDTYRYNVANYCTDKKLMEQRALHETLSRLLWRFSMQNDGDKIDWKGERRMKWCLYYNNSKEQFEISGNDSYKSLSVYFYNNEIAQRAIDEIVLPFMKEHPEFVW